MSRLSDYLVNSSDAEALRRQGATKAIFSLIYAGNSATWDIGVPQPEVMHIEAAGGFSGTILDIGCGTGDNALYLAAKGYRVHGLDFVESAISRARARAAESEVPLPVQFEIGDALEMQRLGRRFDTVLDVGAFHGFSDAQREAYARSLDAVTQSGARFHLLCWSEYESRPGGPRRIAEAEIRASFAASWDILEIREARIMVTNFTGGAAAWACALRRR